jgi:hypothetical protein
MDESILKPVRGYEGLYAASMDGRIWSYPKQKRAWGIWLRPALNEYGYYSVSLRATAGRGRSFLVHRLIADSFLERGHGQAEVNHVDGKKTNNGPFNLEWCTGKENVRHAFELGLSKNGTEKQKANARISIKAAHAKRRELQISATHCKRGHPLSGENLRVDKDGHRCCIICQKRLSTESYQRRKAAGLI